MGEPFNVVEGDLDVPLPRFRRVAQKLGGPREESIPVAIERELAKLEGRLRPGMRIAVGVGSRGLARLAEIVQATVQGLEKRGARPFIVPAMGSHGGGTSAGQLEVLESYGVTPAAMGVPFDASLETVVLGEAPGGFPVHFSKAALAADAVLPVNRIKLHTDFHGPVESGLSKMLAVGFGKHRGATHLHQRGFDTFHEVVPQAALLVLSKVNVLGGIASVENGLDEVARLEFVPADRIPAREPELLELSRSLMPGIPFEKLDVLVVDYLGKDVSGAGMDPNVTGAYLARHIVDARRPQKLVVLRLTERTHGNACGLGVADVTTRAVVENVDFQKTWTNVVTSTLLEGGKTPVWMPDDRSAIALAFVTANRLDRKAPRMVRIRSTLELREMWVSEPLWQREGVRNPALQPRGEPIDLLFDREGNLKDLPLPNSHDGRAAWSAR